MKDFDRDGAPDVPFAPPLREPQGLDEARPRTAPAA
jgi:hypothetical protein